MTEHVYPRRLVMLQMGENCMFCEDPKGSSYLRYVDIFSNLGYIYCSNCCAATEAAVIFWNNNIAFGPANYLKHRNIKVRRTSGEIDTDWIIDSPIISYDLEGNEVLHCYSEKKNIGKWCTIETILELNPITVE